MSVGDFNTKVFAMVTASRSTLVDFVRNHARIRPGFNALLDHCKKNGIEFVVVSNGLDFYIDFILTGLGIENIEIIAAKTEFSPKGMKVKYLSPDGSILMDRFKEVYTKLYTDRGHRVIYIGNGLSDFPSARLSARIFARDELIDCCKEAGVSFTPFEDLNDVVKGLDGLKP